MSQADLDRWKPKAEALLEELLKPVGMPIHTYLVEADGVAKFARDFWEPAADGSRPGLNVVAKLLNRETADEIESLVRAARVVHTSLLYPAEETDEHRRNVERAQFLVTEIGAACEFVLNDGVDEPADEALATAKARASADGTYGTLVQTVADYSGLADGLRARLAELADFDVGLIDEAKTLAGTLSTAGPGRKGVEPNKDVELRNRLFALIGERVGRIRSAAQYVYRNHPEVARRATSVYQRQKRLEARRKAAEAAAAVTGAGGTGAAGTGATPAA